MPTPSSFSRLLGGCDLLCSQGCLQVSPVPRLTPSVGVGRDRVGGELHITRPGGVPGSPANGPAGRQRHRFLRPPLQACGAGPGNLSPPRPRTASGRVACGLPLRRDGHVFDSAGVLETDPNHKHLARDEAAQRQGPHRLARGQTFFEEGRALASRLGVPFAWTLAVVPEVGHLGTRMLRAFVSLQFGDGSQDTAHAASCSAARL